MGRSPIPARCIECGTTVNVSKFRGFCQKCYRKTDYPKITCRHCQEFRVHGGGGLCNPCYQRQTKYNAPIEVLAKLFKDQEGKCGTCDEPLTWSAAHLDHNHKTGGIRGFLCWSCNKVEGLIKNKPYSVVRRIVKWSKEKGLTYTAP